jgi:hypothetical protein
MGRDAGRIGPPSTNGSLVVATGSMRYIEVDRSDVVMAAVREVVSSRCNRE